MKKVYSYLLCAMSITLVSVDICSAQTAPSTALALKPPPTAVTIDGSSQEWGDTLSYYNAEKKVRYTLSNDKDNLYLVIKAKDPIEESNILVGGVTFSIDTKGRKKSSYTTTFPSNGEAPAMNVSKAGDESMDQKKLRATYAKFKKIAVNGFKDIEEDYIATSNTYGIRVAMDYDDKDYLVYEEAIPLTLFHAGDLAKGEWSFNIKLNGLEKPSQQAASVEMAPVPAAGGRGGGGSSSGGGRGGSRKASTSDASNSLSTTITPTIDFWGKFTLAKVQ